MQLTIILINWRDEKLTLDCVERLQSWKSVIPRIIVVDNETTAESKSALESAVGPDNLICNTENQGYGAANNQGFYLAESDSSAFVLFLNCDAEICEADAALLLKTLEQNPDIAIAGPTFIEKSSGTTRCIVGARDISRYPMTRTSMTPEKFELIRHEGLLEPDYIPGTVFLVRKTALQAIGQFDTDYFFSGEAADLCHRAKQTGFRICVNPAAMAHHDTDQTPAKTRETLHTYYNLRNRFVYIRKHHPSQKWRLFPHWVVRGTFGVVKSILTGKLHRARAMGLAIIDGVSGRNGAQNSRLM